jgi:hypothetical protein
MGVAALRLLSSRPVSPREPGVHLGNLALLCLHHLSRELTDLEIATVLQRHPGHRHSALMMRDHFTHEV